MGFLSQAVLMQHAAASNALQPIRFKLSISICAPDDSSVLRVLFMTGALQVVCTFC